MSPHCSNRGPAAGTSGRFPAFDRSRLEVLPLAERHHDMDRSSVMALETAPVVEPGIGAVGGRIREARQKNAATILMMGAHVLRSGVQRYLIDLLERDRVTCLALNGACAIHDLELARIGATTESVARYIRDGRFGMWQETGVLNEIVSEAAEAKQGLGEAVGRAIETGGTVYPHRELSVLAAAWRCGVPATVHVGIGQDIVHQLPNCDGAAYGTTSYTDFLRFARVVENLEGGVVMNFGSAVMAPEVFLKALSMARNVARQEDREIRHFTTLVCDLMELPEDYRREPTRDQPGYYFRPWKTMLVRTVADGGESHYVRGPHHETVPQLWQAATAVA